MVPKNYDEFSDKELVEMHLNGDAQAFNAILTSNYDHLWAVAMRSTYSIHDAQDCLQEAITKAYNTLHTFRGQSSLSSWLHRIVVNAGIDRIRSNKKGPVTMSDYTSVEHLMGVTEDKETVIAVRDAINQLSEEHRIIIQLVDIEGYSIKEISEYLKIPPGTVKSRTGRARARLVQLLSDII